MNEKVLIIFGGLIIGVGLLLMSTYREYKGITESFMLLSGVLGTVISIYQFLRNK